MSDFVDGSTINVTGFEGVVNPDGSVGITVNFIVIAPSGNQYAGQTFLWSPSGQWPPSGDIGEDLKLLAFLAKQAASNATGVQ